MTQSHRSELGQKVVPSRRHPGIIRGGPPVATFSHTRIRYFMRLDPQTMAVITELFLM